MTGKKTAQKTSAEALDDHVADLVRRYEVPAGRYLWPQEEARWRELVFCVLAHVGAPDVPPETARSATDVLVELGLLQIEDLAELVSSGDPPDMAHPHLSIMNAILEREGYTTGQAARALVALCESANSLVRHHEGKVQRYLRLYGQRMLDELDDHFAFSQLGRDDARFIFTHWLQNVLNMPVGLSTPAVQAYCALLSVDLADVAAAADRQDLNLALLDDLIAEYMQDQETLGAE
jgi:hypothetical protein